MRPCRIDAGVRLYHCGCGLWTKMLPHVPRAMNGRLGLLGFSRATPLASIARSQGRTVKTLPAVNFNSPQVATKGKSTGEVFRGWLVFKLFSYDWVVDNSMKLYTWSRKLLGAALTKRLLRATVLGQFSGGVDEEEAVKVAEKLASRNVSAIWNFSIEQDLHEGTTAPTSASEVAEQEAEYTKINQRYLKSIEMSAAYNSDHPAKFAAVKYTAIVDPLLLKKLTDTLKLLDEVFNSLAVSPTEYIADRTVSSTKFKEKFPGIPFEAADTKQELRISDWTARFALHQGLGELKALAAESSPSSDLCSFSELELLQFQGFLQRLQNLGECASAHGIRVLVDAEQTYFQKAIGHLTLNYLMPQFNRTECIFYNTLQAYLTSSYGTLLRRMDQAKHYKIIYGAKLVRGAYMEQERRQAASLGLPSPIHKDKASTDENFHKCLDRLMKETANGNVNLLMGSHNQATVELALKKIQELGISPTDGRMVVGQQMGMGDHLTYPLGSGGYLAGKILAYSPLERMVPFLIRRAQENRGVLYNAKKERLLYAHELRRRMERRND